MKSKWIVSLVVVTAFGLGWVLHREPEVVSVSVEKAAQQMADQVVPQLEAAEIPHLKAGDPMPANLFVELAKLVNPAVVNIYTTYLPKGRAMGYQERTGDPFFDLFQQFMGPYQYEQTPAQSLGTGFIIRDDGLIITNNHVIDRGDTVKVQLTEEKKESFDAKVVGKDEKMDIALIKITAKRKLPVAKLGSSSDLQVGEWVAAFGNPYGHGHTVTKGIVSALGRELNELNNTFPFIQTDASINPGNSGGPLVNTQGEVIGVNSAIDARAQGIGFAIPIDNVKAILSQLEKDGTVKRGFVGIAMADIDEESAKSLGLKETEGALVTQVLPDSPASSAGLEPYDLIVEFDGKKVSSSKDLVKDVMVTPIGKKAPMKVLREGKEKIVLVTVGNTPSQDKVARGERGGVGGGVAGLMAPHDIGFRVTDFTPELAREYGLPPMRNGHPIVTEVERNSAAGRSGLRPGDVILDVNRLDSPRARDVTKNLKKTGNFLRVLKQDRVVLISIR